MKHANIANRQSRFWMWVAAALILGVAVLPNPALSAGAMLPDATLHDLPVVDQDGRVTRFKSELIGERIAVVIPFYTTCTTAYPILVFTFTRLQKMLAEALGQEVLLISVSVEPKIDTPNRMKTFAKRQKAENGWWFLSGEKGDLEKILYGIGILPSENLVEHNHNPITILGSAQTGWRRYHGFPSPTLLLDEIGRLQASN
ncbi:MAG: SCO family protein [Desulfosarcinaceae bacterium]|nr:SCO family protein [Desulfosarcinaceae bacterium]